MHEGRDECDTSVATDYTLLQNSQKMTRCGSWFGSGIINMLCKMPKKATRLLLLSPRLLPSTRSVRRLGLWLSTLVLGVLSSQFQILRLTVIRGGSVSLKDERLRSLNTRYTKRRIIRTRDSLSWSSLDRKSVV